LDLGGVAGGRIATLLWLPGLDCAAAAISSELLLCSLTILYSI